MRFILILAIGLFFQGSVSAQINSGEIQQELEKVQKELQEQLKNLDFGELNLLMDSLVVKGFELPKGFDSENFIMPDDINMDEMAKMLERSFSQVDMDKMMKIMEKNIEQLDIEGMAGMMEKNLNKMDFSELEQLFEPFMDLELLLTPTPEQSEKGKPNTSKKKGKSYKM